MSFMKQYYGRIYAENTREVVRRQVIHQFEQARLVDRNPDDPTRPTNSPNTCYALTEDALEVLTQFGTQTWEEAVTHFLEQHGALWEHYQRSRQALARCHVNHNRGRGAGVSPASGKGMTSPTLIQQALIR